jgi:peroxiredoxin Q/BCP
MFSLFSKPLAVGSPAPEFTLPDQDGKSVALSSLRGKNVVLVFYPKDETSVCRQQLCEFRDEWETVKAKNAVVFGVNADSANSHTKFRERHKFPFPLLIDKGQQVAKLYSASGLIVKRTVYLIGPDGMIRYARRGKPLPSEVLSAA